MIKRLGVNALRLGMYVQRLELSRHSSTTLRDGFLLTTSAQITAIHRVGIKHVWIDELKGVRAVNARPWFSQLPGLSAPPASAADDGIDSALENARQICLDGTLQMKQIFSDARLGKILDPLETLPLVESMIRSIEDNPTALLGMAQLKTQDNYTYQHSVAVCALMIALGLQYRLPQETLQLLGMGGLLHDLGKALIPASILNKPGRLTVAESAIIKQHPLLHPKVRIFFSLLTNEPVPARNLDLAVPSIGDSIAGPDAALGWTGTRFPVPEASLSRNGAGYAPQRQQEREWEGYRPQG